MISRRIKHFFSGIIGDSFLIENYFISIFFILIIFALSYFFLKDFFNINKKKPLTNEEKEKLIKEWKPLPLVNKSVDKYYRELVNVPVANSLAIGEFKTENRLLLNFASSNFLGFANHPKIHEKSVATIKKYAVGSCGPRGFYGTTKAHLDLERTIASHFGYEDCVVYADMLGCISSVISAFSRKKDIIVCDTGCSYFVKHGVKISHSESFFFKHNDIEDLERILKQVILKDKETGRSVKRRYIVVEGLYKSSGLICKLKEIIQLKRKYKFRLILDDSFVFGVLSPLGSLGYWKLKNNSVDIYCAAMSHSLASSCCFSIGNEEICHYQRIGSAGYCFSASAPPFICAAAETATKLLNNESWRIEKLLKNSVYFRKELCRMRSKNLIVSGDKISPVIPLKLKNLEDLEESKKRRGLMQFSSKMLEKGLVVEFMQPTKLTEKKSNDWVAGNYAINVYISAEYTQSQLDKAIKIIIETSNLIGNNF